MSLGHAMASSFMGIRGVSMSIGALRAWLGGILGAREDAHAAERGCWRPLWDEFNGDNGG